MSTFTAHALCGGRALRSSRRQPRVQHVDQVLLRDSLQERQRAREQRSGRSKKLSLWRTSSSGDSEGRLLDTTTGRPVFNAEAVGVETKETAKQARAVAPRRCAKLAPSSLPSRLLTAGMLLRCVGVAAVKLLSCGTLWPSHTKSWVDRAGC